ncbi:hypothetical protein ABPG75_013772 [Micractinium tetrahymenae]
MADYNDAAMGGEAETIEIRVARRIFVGNLSWQTSWQDLKDHFSTVGRVRFADVLREAGPGSRSKGCGIIEFESPDEAAAAIQQLNDSELGGRKIWIREDREDFELRGDSAYRSGRAGSRIRSRSPRRAQRGGGGYSGEAVTVGRRVFVGNLSFDTTWQELKDHFKQAGRVAHADILADAEGRSRGAGIVEFDHPADALRAISMLSNSTLGGRTINVREDREDPAVPHGGPPPRYGSGPPPPRYGGGGGGGGGGGSSAAPGTQIVVHGLPYRMSWQELKDLCRPAGAVVRADIVTNPDGSSKGWGVAAFATPSDAQAAIQLLNGTELEGRTVSAKIDRFAS